MGQGVFLIIALALAVILGIMWLFVRFRERYGSDPE